MANTSLVEAFEKAKAKKDGTFQDGEGATTSRPPRRRIVSQTPKAEIKRMAVPESVEEALRRLSNLKRCEEFSSIYYHFFDNFDIINEVVIEAILDNVTNLGQNFEEGREIAVVFPKDDKLNLFVICWEKEYPGLTERLLNTASILTENAIKNFRKPETINRYANYPLNSLYIHAGNLLEAGEATPETLEFLKTEHSKILRKLPKEDVIQVERDFYRGLCAALMERKSPQALINLLKIKPKLKGTVDSLFQEQTSKLIAPHKIRQNEVEKLLAIGEKLDRTQEIAENKEILKALLNNGTPHAFNHFIDNANISQETAQPAINEHINGLEEPIEKKKITSLLKTANKINKNCKKDTVEKIFEYGVERGSKETLDNLKAIPGIKRQLKGLYFAKESPFARAVSEENVLGLKALIETVYEDEIEKAVETTESSLFDMVGKVLSQTSIPSNKIIALLQLAEAISVSTLSQVLTHQGNIAGAAIKTGDLGTCGIVHAAIAKAAKEEPDIVRQIIEMQEGSNIPKKLKMFMGALIGLQTSRT